MKCGEYIEHGYVFTLDTDLEKFFDTVSHSKLIEVLSHTIKDVRVLSLIHRYLNEGVIHCGRYEPSQLGVPQGGPLSPILSNIILKNWIRNWNVEVTNMSAMLMTLLSSARVGRRQNAPMNTLFPL